MSDSLPTAIRAICDQFENDPHRMMDIARAVQHRFNCVSPAAMDIIAAALDVARVEVESFVSFYTFLSEEPTGDIVIRLCNDIVDRFHGGDEVAAAFAQELGIQPGQTTSDLRISLAYTACIGMSDQAPAALVNDVVVTELSTDKARRIVRDLKEHRNPQRLVEKLGDGNNTHPLVQSMVRNCIRREGPVIFAPFESGKALRKALSMSPAEIIRNIKTSRLRGRGGAGFPTGIKWEFTRAAPGRTRYIICNADEGEPGTFKDRVILTERPDLLFEGMTIGGYALGGAAKALSICASNTPIYNAFSRRCCTSAARPVYSAKTSPAKRASTLIYAYKLVPVPIYAAQKQHLSIRARGGAATRAIARPFPHKRDTSVNRPASTMSRRCAAWRASSNAAPPSLPNSAHRPAPARSC